MGGASVATPSPRPQAPSLTTTELGLEVPEQAPVWREHTAERWRERDPNSYAQCVELIRTGVTNQGTLAKAFGKSRNSINALMMAEFTEAQMVEIGKKASRIAELAGIDKTTELLDKASAAKDVGGVAMATKLMHDISQSLNDKPAQVIEYRAKVTFADVERLRLEARQKAQVIEAEIIPSSVTEPA